MSLIYCLLGYINLYIIQDIIQRLNSTNFNCKFQLFLVKWRFLFLIFYKRFFFPLIHGF
jgi:hypothetical protein